MADRPDPNYEPSEEDFKVDDVSDTPPQEAPASDEPRVVDARKPFELWFEENKWLVLMGIVLTVVAISALVLLRQIKGEKFSAASEQYTAAKTEEDFQRVIDDHGGSLQAGNAYLEKAQLKFASGNSDDAFALIRKFVEQYQDHPLHAKGLISLGTMEEEKGELDAALQNYRDAVALHPESEFAPFAMLREGDLLLGKGETAAARSVYERILLEYPSPGRQMGNEIDNRLQITELVEKRSSAKALPPRPAPLTPEAPAPGGNLLPVPGQPAIPTPGTPTPAPGGAIPTPGSPVAPPPAGLNLPPASGATGGSAPTPTPGSPVAPPAGLKIPPVPTGDTINSNGAPLVPDSPPEVLTPPSPAVPAVPSEVPAIPGTP